MGAVLFLLSHLRAARAVRTLVRRRDREIGRDRRRAHRQTEGARRLPSLADHLSVRSRRRADGSWRGSAWNPALSRIAAGSAVHQAAAISATRANDLAAGAARRRFSHRAASPRHPPLRSLADQRLVPPDPLRDAPPPHAPPIERAPT